MKFARAMRRSRTPSAIELAPLVDVVFLLLIFFMVSTTFAPRMELEVALPEAGAGIATAQASDIQVRVSAAGRYTVDERLLASDDVAALRVALTASRQDDSRVVVAADALASHQAVVRVLEAASALGLRDVRILTRHPETERATHDNAAG